jgi:predicted permease
MSFSLDIKYAARLLSKKPSFTALTVSIVAIGLGLTLYTFSLLNNLLFTPLSFSDGKPIYALESPYDHTHLERRELMAIDVYNLKEHRDIFDEIGVYQMGITFVGGTEEGLRKYNSGYVSSNLFSFASTQPILGRTFVENDHLEGAEAVVILGHKAWKTQFASDPNIIGSIVPIDGSEPARIIGVMPEDFAFPAVAEIWQPLSLQAVAPTERDFVFVFAFAKLADGVSLAQARLFIDTKSKEVNDLVGDEIPWLIGPSGEYFTLEPFKKAYITQYYGMFIALLIVVFLILILACINVGNLLLARVNERIKEVAIRVALGVPKKRLILQMLWESIFICAIGGSLAFLLAGWGLEITNQVFDNTYQVDNLKPFWWQVGLDVKSIIVLVVAIFAMILITGLIPAWRALTGDFNAVLRDGTRGALGKKAAKTTRVLVISEILLSCVVLVMATILLVSSYSAGNADYGIDTENRLTAQLQISPSTYPIRFDTEFEAADRLARTKFYYDLKRELESRDNILDVGYMSQLPGTGGGTSFFVIEGQEKEVIEENPYSNNEGAGTDSWDALGMKIIQGRDFDYRDAAPEARSIIVNESIARDFFPNGDAIGKRVRRANRPEADWFTIVGVVTDTYHGSTMEFSSAAYNTYHSMDNGGMFRAMTAIHYTGSEAKARQTLFDAVNKIDPDIGVFHVQSYDALIEKPILLIAAVSKIFLICGVVAAFLAASGIYAVAANSVQQRTQEIGIRRALGSTDGKIMRLFMNQASWQLMIGLLSGLGIAAWLINLMSSTMIFSESSYIIGLIAMPIMIALMVLVATYLPTKKVVNMEPSDALHHN